MQKNNSRGTREQQSIINGRQKIRLSKTEKITIHENMKNYFHKMIFGTILFSFWFPNCILHPKDEIWGLGGGQNKLKIGVLSCTTTTLMSSVDSLLLSD